MIPSRAMPAVATHNSLLVSVILPIYKVRDYLNECIKSIVDQLYSHLEIILVDDGSPDGCGDMCDIWSSRNHRIVSLHKTNGGISDARNFGLDRANGEYIVCVDSDDLIKPTLVEKSLQAAISQDADLLFYRFSYLSENGETRPDNGIASFPGDQLCTAEQALTRLWEGRVQNFSWSIFAKRECYNNVRFPKGRLMEDMATTYRLIQESKYVYFLDEELYRVREGSILDGINERICSDLITTILEMNNFAESYYPSLMVLERNWAIRTAFMDATWVYQQKGKLNRADYTKLWNKAMSQIREDVHTIGWRQVDWRSRIKIILVQTGFAALFGRIALARSRRK